MASSRGDTKPCTAVDCGGTMQFGRRKDGEASSASKSAAVPARDRRPTDAGLDDKGWVCSTDPTHFRQAS